MAKELLARDGDAAVSSDIINAIDKDGRSAFHYACLNDDIPLLTVLLADPRVDVQLKSPKGETAVHMASLYAALEALKLLVKDGRLLAGDAKQVRRDSHAPHRWQW